MKVSYLQYWDVLGLLLPYNVNLIVDYFIENLFI